MYPERQIFFVLGISKSGFAAAKFLRGKGATVYLYDDISSDRIEENIKTLERLGARRISKQQLEKVSDVCDVLVLSPGIAIDHPIAVDFKRKGKAVIGESELAARYTRSPIIAVTGTNGKTTTVSMLTAILQNGGMQACACGNVGTPMISYADDGDKQIMVAEISSFQLETLNSIRPHVAIVLNITQDHLNRHYNMENYIFLKAKLLKNLTACEYAVLNYDDTFVRSFAEKTRANILFFSLREAVTGAYFLDGNLYFGKEKLLAADELPVTGMHNVQNALAAIAAAKLMGVKTQAIVEALKQFQGVAHRIDTVGEIDGVTYINDSKATNVDATLKAVACMKQETVLLLGGKDKGYNYQSLFQALKQSKVVHAVVYGENRYALLKCAQEQAFDRVTLSADFFDAVKIASVIAKPGQTVLLSPASASFDAFSGYEERGDAFVAWVREREKTTIEEMETTQQEQGDEGTGFVLIDEHSNAN